MTAPFDAVRRGPGENKLPETHTYGDISQAAICSMFVFLTSPLPSGT